MDEWLRMYCFNEMNVPYPAGWTNLLEFHLDEMKNFFSRWSTDLKPHLPFFVFVLHVHIMKK
jgi:hypothetical protein